MRRPARQVPDLQATLPDTPKHVGDVRSPWLFRSLVACSILAFAAVLYLTSYKSFFYDEWIFIAARRPWTVDVFFLSHNGDWSTIPVLVWKILFVTVGIRSHLPYEAVALTAHVVCVVLVFILIRRRSGDLPAFAAALTLLVLGKGAENIVFAFQMVWLGSIAFGLVAMLLVSGDPPFPGRVLPVSVALLLSLMCSNLGLVFMAAIGAELLFDSHRRRFLVVLLLPTVAFAAWFFTLDTGSVPGSPGISNSFHHGPRGLAFVVGVVALVATGIGACASSVLGGVLPGAVALLILSGLIAYQLHRRHRVEAWQLGAAAGLLTWFTLIGIGRIEFGPAIGAQSRFVYVGVVFLLPLVAHAIRDLPWTGFWQPALTVAFALTLSGNIIGLREAALSQTDYMKFQAAELQTVQIFRGAPDMDVNRLIDDGIVPALNPKDFLSATDELGSPIPHKTFDALPHLPPQAVDRVMVNLFGEALSLTPDATRSSHGLPCRVVDSTLGSTIDLHAANGELIMLLSSKGGNAALYLGLESPPGAVPLRQVLLEPATPEWVHLPDTGKPVIWQLRITTGSIGQLRVCGAASLQVFETATNLYSADAAVGTPDTGWSVVPDVAASGGRSAKAASGIHVSYSNDWFGSPHVPDPGAYDVWFRVRVKTPSGLTPEMTLGLWDVAGGWVGSNVYQANQLGADYRWVKVATDVTPVPGNSVVFLASFQGSLGTDWYVDEAVMLPTGKAYPPSRPQNLLIDSGSNAK